MTALTLGHGEGWVLYLYLCRFIAGMGIGGEYAAINSAIDELIPSRYRGRVDIAVNGTYWGGALLATLVTLAVINNVSVGYSWRIAFLAGPALGFLIIFVRRNLPESPRWLLMQGRVDEAEAAMAEIERNTIQSGGSFDEVDESKAIEVRPAPADRLCRPRPHPVRHLSAALDPGRVVDDHPVVPLQRHLFHLLAGAHEDLWSSKGVDAVLLHVLCRRKSSGSADDRQALRHGWPPQDDHRNVPSVRHPAGGQCLSSSRLDSWTRSARPAAGA